MTNTNGYEIQKWGTKWVLVRDGKVVSTPDSKKNIEELLLYRGIKAGKSSIHAGHNGTL